MVRNFDMVVIGAGPDGYTAAQRASQLSLSVALAETKKIGGIYVNRGCIPTKALLHASNMSHMMQSYDVLGVSMDFIAFDFEKMQKYKKQAVAKYREGIKAGLDREKVEIIHGIATLRRDRTVEVELAEGGREFPQGNAIIIVTGVVSTMDDMPGTSLPGIQNSDRLLAAENWNFDRLTTMSGGVIAMEFATMFSNLCPSVTIVERQKHLMTPVSNVISAELEKELRYKGAQVYCDATVAEIMEEEGSLNCVITPNRGGEPIKAGAGQVLMAIGRRPDVDKLLGENTSLGMQNGKIVVNSDFETNEPGVFAIGDVVARTQLAHMAAAQSAYVVGKIAEGAHNVRLEVVPNGMFVFPPIVPNCIYTDLEIATIGIMEKRVKQGGLKARYRHFSMRDNGKSTISGEENGFIHLVSETYSNTIVGAQMMCFCATDMIEEIATAIANGLIAEEMSFIMRTWFIYSEGVGAAIGDAIRREPAQGIIGEIGLDDVGQMKRVIWYGLDDPRRCERQMG